MFFLFIIKSISFYSFSLGTTGGINNNKMTQTANISIVDQSGFSTLNYYSVHQK